MITLNGVEVKFGQYPNGETLMPEIDPIPSIPWRAEVGPPGHHVMFSYETDADLMHLFLLGCHLDNPKVLTITYMPYSRMDRAVGNHCFSLQYVADLINQMGFNKVHIIEPHSDVTTDLILNSQAVFISEKIVPEWVFREVGFDRDVDYVVFPDEGAAKRYGSQLPGDIRYITATKKRDFDTGQITEITVEQPLARVAQLGAKAVIWDDLCSRGGTFMGVGQQLKDMGFAEVHLYVTHLEWAVTEGSLLKEGSPIDSVYATDSMGWMTPWFPLDQKPWWLDHLQILELTQDNSAGKVVA